MGNVHICILSGGSGTRMGSQIPKQFLQIAEKPLLSLTLQPFLKWEKTGSIILVANEVYMKQTAKILESEVSLNKSEVKTILCKGGSSRHASTMAAIHEIKKIASTDDLIFIHDGARPIVTPKDMDELFNVLDDLDKPPVASLASPITDTVVQGNGLPGITEKIVDRSTLFSVQTPQGFRMDILEQLMLTSGEFTDLLSWALAGGIQGSLVPSNPGNIKVTQPSDLEKVEIFLKKQDTGHPG